MRVLVLLLFASQLALAQPAPSSAYVPFDAAGVLIPADKSTGRGPAVDLARLDAQLDELARHAKNYPPRFASEADRQQATSDVKALVGMLDALNVPDKPNPDLLRRAAFACSLAHNLDVPGAAPKAADYFGRLLKVDPDDPQGNFMFGAFLGGAGKSDAALPYLLKADALGVRNAPYALAMAYLSLGDKAKAIESLHKYKTLAPDDKSVDPLLEAIRSGKITVKQTAGKP